MRLRHFVAAALLTVPAPAMAQDDVNRVLGWMETGTREFWEQDYRSAATAFDDCIRDIELVFLNDDTVVKARSLWYEEGAKTFKGEPYERAMVYYYRGLIFLADGDYENARAAFRQGTLQDAFAEEDQFQADFALLYFLEAWASHLNGDKDLRDEALQRVKALRPDYPGIADGDDTLVLVETGLAPRKLGDGVSHSYFVYRRGKGFKENGAAIVAAGGDLPLFPLEDIYRQASTRGGREVDQIFQGKARFKQTAADAGSAMAGMAQGVSALGGSGGIAAGLGAVGAIASLLSNRARVKADTRTWTSLPDSVHIRTMDSRKSVLTDPKVRFMANGQPAEMPEQPLTFFQNARGHKMALVRRPASI